MSGFPIGSATKGIYQTDAAWRARTDCNNWCPEASMFVEYEEHWTEDERKQAFDTIASMGKAGLFSWQQLRREDITWIINYKIAATMITELKTGGQAEKDFYDSKPNFYSQAKSQWR